MASVAGSGAEHEGAPLAASKAAITVAALAAQVVVCMAAVPPAVADGAVAATAAAALPAEAMEVEPPGMAATRLACLVAAEWREVHSVASATLVVTVACTRAAQRASSSEIDPPAGLSRTVRCSRRRTVPQTAPRSPVPPSLRIGTPHRSSCLQTSHQPTPRTETATPGTLDRPRDCTPRPNPQPCHRAPGQTPMR